jgi:hypothetical protein
MTLGLLYYVQDNSKFHFEENPTLLNYRSMNLHGLYLLMMNSWTSYRIYIGYPGRGLLSFKQTLTFSVPSLYSIVY